MAMFTTRVELHSATYADYETLHESMRQKGFSREISGSNGLVYQLPTAEYYCEGAIAQSTVLTAAQQAAATTGRSAAVLVTEAVSSSWSGLPQIR
jgi:hypothetical protein